jgi:pSer/pThr/pTyr-binding forkhead associated (FHA) protein
VIGRDPTATVHLTDEEVSRRHAIVSLGEGSMAVEDLGSFNGTHLDGGEIKGETPLRVGDRIRVGQTVLELREVAGADPENLKPTKTSLPKQP